MYSLVNDVFKNYTLNERFLLINLRRHNFSLLNDLNEEI